MLQMEIEGDSVEDALQKALEKLGLSKDEIEYEVLETGKASFLGIGKKVPALIRVTYRESTAAPKIIDQIKGIIAFLDDTCEITTNHTGNNRYVLTINSPNKAHIIGKSGKSLQALQTLVNALLQKHENRYKIVLDIDQYNKKKEKHLLDWAKGKAQRVVEKGKPIVLKSLNSYERRLIHMELQAMDEVVTESKGEGKIKNIKISPRAHAQRVNANHNYGA